MCSRCRMAISGMVTPLIAAAAMSGSSILVMLNALRARCVAVGRPDGSPGHSGAAGARARAGRSRSRFSGRSRAASTTISTARPGAPSPTTTRRRRKRRPSASAAAVPRHSFSDMVAGRPAVAGRNNAGGFCVEATGQALRSRSVTSMQKNVGVCGPNDLPGQVVLVLQGGGALGAYQAGVYQALHEAGIEPDWIIGTSIGAINASLIAGNEPENRLARLQEFWRRMEQNRSGALREPVPASRQAGLLVDGDQRHSRLLRAQSAGACRRRISARRRSRRLLFDRAAGEDAERAGRFRSGQSLRAAADGRRRACRAPARCAISTAATAS